MELTQLSLNVQNMWHFTCGNLKWLNELQLDEYLLRVYMSDQIVLQETIKLTSYLITHHQLDVEVILL